MFGQLFSQTFRGFFVHSVDILLCHCYYWYGRLSINHNTIVFPKPFFWEICPDYLLSHVTIHVVRIHSLLWFAMCLWHDISASAAPYQSARHTPIGFTVMCVPWSSAAIYPHATKSCPFFPSCCHPLGELCTYNSTLSTPSFLLVSLALST